MATLKATADFVYQVEMDIAEELLFCRPDVAEQAASYAHTVALQMGRPDLAWSANELLCALHGDLFAEVA